MKKMNLLPWRRAQRKQKQRKVLCLFFVVTMGYLCTLIFFDKLLDIQVKKIAIYRDQEAIKWIYLQSTLPLLSLYRE